MDLSLILLSGQIPEEEVFLRIAAFVAVLDPVYVEGHQVLVLKENGFVLDDMLNAAVYFNDWSHCTEGEADGKADCKDSFRLFFF